MIFVESFPARLSDRAPAGLDRQIVVSRGLRANEREQAAELFWEAFSGKLGLVLNPREKALAYLAQTIHLDHALCARDAGNRLIGIAGVKTASGGLLGGGWAELRAVYGAFGAFWRGLFLDLTSLSVVPGQMVLDGLFVSEHVRGQGIGSDLIRAVLTEARLAGLREVRLDVVDTNPRARALYQRHGFRHVGLSRMGILRLVFGFRSSEQMVRQV